MVGKERAELKNRVLQFLIDNPMNYSDGGIYEGLNKPMDSLPLFSKLLQEIAKEGRDYVDPIFNRRHPNHILMISCNSFTKDFLNHGGFVNQWASQREADIEELHLAAENQRIKNLQEENLILSNQVASMKLKTHWIPLILSGISGLIAAGSLIYSINTSSDTVSQKEFKSLQQNIQAIKTEFNGENKELKERLYKVEMLIAVYENDKEIDRKR